MLKDTNAGNSKEAFEAMLRMDKMDIKTLEQAYHEKSEAR
jgi:hypothetical protein